MKKIINLKKLYPLFIFLIFGCSSTPISVSGPWLKTETAHLVLHYQPRSHAASNIRRAAAEYERSYLFAVRSLPSVNSKVKLDVYLHDSLKAAGHANRQNRSSHYVYSRVFKLTSPHEMMHHFLYEMNPKVPLRLEEGVARFFESRVILGSSVRLYQLAKFSPERLLDVREVFSDHYKTDVEGNVAAAFAAFFMHKMGRGKFWEFYNSLDKARWGLHLEKYFKTDIYTINREFRAYVRSLKSPPVVFKAM